ncbi:hypothetical protein ACFQY5_33285 [Paeniroseomonas aquatica]|uniref:Uncharacterized protein n=1 Tax=Paeniroseomonas aquatica TaxID=373043 RepID=A0ABT8A223_9PROT|nr:hypothetical protein [Paeniroseomonas aquatica]MDN3563548.1 hypothetical protein [Paeniroseomonas aquatica]
MAPDWPAALRVYLGVIAVGNLVWEAAHLPLYTLWNTGTAQEKLFAIVHCTGGDVLIALTCLALALITVGHRDWPLRAFRAVAAVTVVLGVGYTIFSEWLNIVVRQSWAYSELMPVVPIIDTGVTPLLQWLVVPLVALWLARRTVQRNLVVTASMNR